ncbi:hypothetical protein EYR41_011870 [Orbilia oligospora]|uniref:Uncharacterized protein n=1 Tax=Orbilia oligospora TaxID=2813651 RepID=A0A7C8TQK2_ORBOL|nr:hypothetical protein TWF751_003164 [Orbilia oligospora]TGJ62681.1 hypothetical protein EYR41_011870 [Orbilia oligospora]
MDDQPPTTPPKKSIKSYIATISRKVSQKTVTGAQQLGTLARSATTVSRRSKTSKSSGRKYSTTTNSTTTTTMKFITSVFIPSSDVNGMNNNNSGNIGGGPPAPRLPNVVYRSPDADFIESQMEATIRSIGASNNGGGENKEEEGGDGDGKEEKEGKKKDRMGGYTIRIISPNCNNEA